MYCCKLSVVDRLWEIDSLFVSVRLFIGKIVRRSMRFGGPTPLTVGSHTDEPFFAYENIRPAMGASGVRMRDCVRDVTPLNRTLVEVMLTYCVQFEGDTTKNQMST